MTNGEAIGATRDPLIGQVIHGRYRVCRVIGKGGMGIVYEAMHLLLDRKVALKRMAAHALIAPEGAQRFRREAQAAASVGNSHVVDVLDMGELDDGSFYIVQEHLDGVDLGFAVALEGRFPLPRAIHVLCQLCDALSAVHAASIVHRDLKPENIFLVRRDGVPDFVKVLDFGICKFTHPDRGALTASGDRVGTPLFMAPEQVEGRDIDHRADVYALGAVLYFLLTGRAPFEANVPKLYLMICHEPVPSVRSDDLALPAALDEVVRRALSKDPEHRFDSCRAFKEALLPFLGRAFDKTELVPFAAAVAPLTDDAATEWNTASLVRAFRLGRSRWSAAQIISLAVLTLSLLAGISLMQQRHHQVPLYEPVGPSPSASTVSPPAPVPEGDSLPAPPLPTAAPRAESNVPAKTKRHEPTIAPVSSRATPSGSAALPLPEPPPVRPEATALPRDERGGANRADRPAFAGEEPHLNHEPKRGL